VPPEDLSLDSASSLLRAYSIYCNLVQASGNSRRPDAASDGKLLYVGELDEVGRLLTLAGNVAGCATLAAAADPDSQKQAIRDGVVDFLVTSLDEALRILKNELRKHSTVAVCVGASTVDIEREMLERGVQPDLSRQDASVDGPFTASSREALRLNADRPLRSQATVVWSAESQPAKWLPRFDAIALECLQPSDAANRRWIQRLPRYLGRLSSHLHLVRSDREFAASFVEHMRGAFEQGAVATAATIWVASEAGPEIYDLKPATRSSS